MRKQKIGNDYGKFSFKIKERLGKDPKIFQTGTLVSLEHRSLKNIMRVSGYFQKNKIQSCLLEYYLEQIFFMRSVCFTVYLNFLLISQNVLPFRKFELQIFSMTYQENYGFWAVFVKKNDVNGFYFSLQFNFEPSCGAEVLRFEGISCFWPKEKIVFLDYESREIMKFEDCYYIHYIKYKITKLNRFSFQGHNLNKIRN